MAAEETGYGKAEHKRVKDLMNARGAAEWLRDIKTLGLLWRDDATKNLPAFGEPVWW